MGDRHTAVGSIGARRRLERLVRAPPFSGVPREVLREIALGAIDRHAPRGTALFRSGDTAASMFVLGRGAVRIGGTTPDGRSIVFRFVAPGESFGVLPLLDGAPRSGEARAIVDSLLVSVPYDVVAEHIERSPPVALAFARLSADRLRRDRTRLAELTARDIRGRIVSALFELGTTYGVAAPDGVLIEVPIRHEDLAGFVGTTRETVSRTLSAFASRGFLRRVGDRYVLLDRLGVAAASGA